MQTPQHFINPDPIQTNLAIAGTWPDEQRYFFDVLMAAKDAWGLRLLLRHLVRHPHSSRCTRIGGFPTDSVTEDYLLTLRLRRSATAPPISTSR